MLISGVTAMDILADDREREPKSVLVTWTSPSLPPFLEKDHLNKDLLLMLQSWTHPQIQNSL